MARYLSRAELSYIAGKYIEMYYALFGISKNDPAPINPEQFANSVLGLNLKMLPLCSDGHILGLTVFQRCSFTATLEDGTKLVEVFMPRDIVIDSALAADRCTGCRNFTIAHEAAHQILADLFPNDFCFRTTTEKQSSAVGTLPIGRETEMPRGKNGRRIPLQQSC